MSEKKDVSSLRKQIIEILNKSPQPIEKLAKEIGISKLEMFKFIKSEKDADIKSISKIQKWLEDICEGFKKK